MVPKLCISLSMPSELLPSAAENFSTLRTVLLIGPQFSLTRRLDAAKHLVGALGDGAHGLDDILELGPLGHDGRHVLALRRLQRIGAGLAAEQLHRDHTGETLRLDPGAGVDPQRRRAVDLNTA